jgi:hypothetical protein
MAGDWIKFEKATLAKPEVLRVAAVLGISRYQVVGMCLAFWSWCDEQLRECHALGVTESMIDDLVGATGFASALLDVGWLRVRNGSLAVPNFDRHLSESAKKRALSGKRQAKKRHAEVTKMSRSERDENVTREEKRREERDTSNDVSGREPPTRDGPKKKPKVPFLKPTIDEVRAYITAQRYQVDPQRFFDHYESNGWRVGRNAMQDWRAAVRNWHRTPLDGQASHPTPKPKPEYPTLKPITGMADD